MTHAQTLTRRQYITWRIIQATVWTLGVAILLALVFRPQLGIHAFWNVLIPVAPLVFVFVPGLWRSVCPLGTSGLLPRHLGMSRRRLLSPKWQVRMGMIGVASLFLIVPLRHVLLDTNGPATAITILLLAAVAITIGTQVEWRSGWCSGMCPVHQVEKLYGQRPIATFQNAHCTVCRHCVGPCPDSTSNLSPITNTQTRTGEKLGLVMAGSFAGFVWGWFQVPDYSGVEGWSHLTSIYAWPLGAAAVSLGIFMGLNRALRGAHTGLLIRIFATAAVSLYYWYRLPALFGFGPFPGDGMLVDLREVLPTSFPIWCQISSSALFAWWLIGRRAAKRSWSIRPPKWADQSTPPSSARKRA